MDEHHDVLIVGAGFSGLGAAVRLRQAGRHDFVVLERADDVGGTWRDNDYPGAACDVPSHLYSLSFAPNPRWSRSFSPQPEIQQYLQGLVTRYDLAPHLRLGHELVEARWDEATARWHVRTGRGSFTGRVLVIGTGPLSAPKLPAIDGLADFAGTTFHSARWRHDHDLAGRRVAVIGTGASAIQFVPRIAEEVEHLTVFQRTPPWIIPRNDRPISALEHWLYEHLPPTRLAARAGIYTARETLAVGMTLRPRLLDAVAAMARGHLQRQVADPALRERLLPDYRIGCKRILLSNDFYPALARDNVELVTEGIERIEPHAVRTADGVDHPVDTIVFGTGFEATRPPVADAVTGRDGARLADAWADGMTAYRGTTVAGFPNLFLLIGPNTGLGHNSMIYIIESQLNYLVTALSKMDEHGIVAVEVDAGAQHAYNEGLQRRLDGTVWNTGGCASWYLDANGRNTTLWPSFTWRFRQLTRRFDPRGYHLRTAQEVTSACPPQTPVP
ncbi:flavin-containing monooxygenase [Actinocatenispora sera]|uniref:Flavin-binding monooxygenase n=1 Tax=Actinocatenispora sera TaxID=390989 RepID=A0A810L4H5_9ACTN|nr:NAD(P)/FAD-dependent oxidoreductase [Actinocatenispora sera]BCJ29261.1 flavin-binding monooxygenase [Actinocatenispora sera]